jgi:uncharacterized phage protein gp47/JayE
MNRTDLARLARANILASPGSGLDPAKIERPGSPLAMLFNAQAAMALEAHSRSTVRLAKLSVGSAVDAELDALLLDLSKGKLPRKPAAAATMRGYVSRATAGPEASVAAGTEVLAGGLTWTLDEAARFTPVGTSYATSAPVSLTCSTLGRASNGIGPDAFTFKNPGALFDPKLTIETVEAPSAGGDDVEGDDAYRERFALWSAGLGNNLLWLAAGVLGVPGVAFATAVEDLDSEGNPSGTATVYCADIEGRMHAGLLERVGEALPGFRLPGQHVKLVGTLTVQQPIVLSFAILADADVATVQATAKAAVVAYVNALLPGETLDTFAIAALLRAIPGVVLLPNIPFGTLTPAAPLTPTDKRQAFRTTSALVTFG